MLMGKYLVYICSHSAMIFCRYMWCCYVIHFTLLYFTLLYYWMLSAFKTRDKATMMTLYKSLVRSHLEYCCPLWNCFNDKDIQQLEGMQRTFTSKIDGIQHLNYWQRLKALDLMSLQRRREGYLIIHMWKVLHYKCPNDIGIQFSVTLRHGQKAVVSSIAKSSSQHNQALHDNSFAVTGPRLKKKGGTPNPCSWDTSQQVDQSGSCLWKVHQLPAEAVGWESPLGSFRP